MSLGSALAQAAAEGLEANAWRWCRFIGGGPGDYVEVQALDVGGMSLCAHAPDPNAFVRLLAEADVSPVPAQGIYVIANLVDAVVAMRALPGQWRQAMRGTSTTDKDIRAYSTCLIDVDVTRPTGTSATNEELAAAQDVATAIYTTLTTALGGHDTLAIGHSGNGCSIFPALDRLPNTPAVKTLIGGVLSAIKALHDTDRVKIDAHLSDPKRLVPAFGTVKRKGPAGDPLRPHRRTGLLVPETVRRLSYAELQVLHDRLQARLPPRPAHVPTISSTLSEPVNDSLELKDLRKRLSDRKREKAASTEPKDVEHFRILGALLAGTPLAVPGTETSDTLPSGRATVLNQACTLLAFALPLGTPWEVAVELLRPSVAAMDTEPEGLAYWLGPEQAEGSYNRALDRAFTLAREHEARRLADEAVRNTLLGLVSRPDAPPPTGPTLLAAGTQQDMHGGAAAQVVPVDDPDWMQHFTLTSDKRLESCGWNVYVALSKAPVLRGTIRFNDVSKDIEVHGGPFAGMAPAVLATAVEDWLHRVVKLKVAKSTVEDRLLLVAYENRYDPIADFLRGQVWDGVPRLNGFFLGESYVCNGLEVPAYTRCKRVAEDGHDLTQHLMRVAPAFFIGAAARGLRPGCQHDTMLVLEGPEGILKTSLLRTLFQPWYIVTRMNFDSKDALLIPAANWGVEVGELSSVRKSEDGVLLDFLTTRVDKFRPPYGRRQEEAPRRSVLIGTTNQARWLTPGKGRRRYMPVWVDSINLKAVERDRNQLWAEAVTRFYGYTDIFGTIHPPERWHLVDEERAEADREADARVEESYVEQRIRAWYYSRKPGSRQEAITVVDVANLLELPADRVGKMTSDITQALTRLGFVHGRTPKGGRAWLPTQAMLGAPEVPGDDPLGRFAAAKVKV